MSTALTIVIALLVFGFLIFIHEFGHYIFARIFKVKINEFSIGMGPKLVWYDSKKTGIRYALSMLPIGGYVAMAGEDDESDDPNSFDKKPAWQRFIITAAGATVNVLAGFIATLLLVVMLTSIGNTTIAGFIDKSETGYEISSSESGLLVNDEIIAVDGVRVKTPDELSYEIMRRGTEPLDITVIRDGVKMTVKDVVFPSISEQGQSFGAIDFAVYRIDKNFGTVINQAWRKSCLTVRMCWESLYDLFTGRYTFAAVSGPVGISSAIGDAAKMGVAALLNIIAIISINLGFMNLLPIPALDGGRLITLLVEMITKKKLPTKVEGIINAVGLMALLALSFVIMIKDVIQIIV